MTDNDALVAELRSDRDRANSLVAELRETIAEREHRIVALQQSDTTLQALVSEFAAFGLGMDTPVADAKSIVAEFVSLRKSKLVTDIDALVAEMIESEPLRPFIMEYLVEETADGARMPLVATLDEAKARVEGLQAKPHIQSLAKTLVREMRGPNAFVGKGGDKKLVITDEDVQVAREKFSI